MLGLGGRKFNMSGRRWSHSHSLEMLHTLVLAAAIHFPLMSFWLVLCSPLWTTELALTQQAPRGGRRLPTWSPAQWQPWASSTPKENSPRIPELGDGLFVARGGERSKLASLLCLMEGPPFWKAQSSHKSRRLQKLVSSERALYSKKAPMPLSTLWGNSGGHVTATAVSLLTPFNDGKRKKSKVQDSLGPCSTVFITWHFPNA